MRLIAVGAGTILEVLPYELRMTAPAGFAVRPGGKGP